MDYLSCSQKKKKNSLIRKLFTKKGGKKDENDGPQDRQKQMDEDTWRRIKNMEQSRQVFAMKSHIEKLEDKLSSPHAKSNSKKHKKKHSVVSETVTKTIAEKDCSPVTEEAVLSKDETNKDRKLLNIAKKQSKSRKLLDSPTDVVIVDKGVNGLDEKDGLKGCEEKEGFGTKKGFGNKKAQNNMETKKTEQRIFKRRSEEICVNKAEMPQQDATPRLTNIDGNTGQDAMERDVSCSADDGEREDGVDTADSTLAAALPESHIAVEVQVNKDKSDWTSCQDRTQFERPDSAKETDSCLVTCKNESEVGGCLETSVNESEVGGCWEMPLNGSEVKTNVTDSERGSEQSESNSNRVAEVEQINQSLEKKVSALEEEIWLANEDKVNTQMMLECQKDKAIKNLSLKFEEINKKTLCEFKGIFERRLKEINDEKILLQEKLGKMDNVGEKLKAAEERVAELAEENITLKQRCRKLSAAFGLMKKKYRKICCEDERREISTQTDAIEMRIEKNNIAIQCEDLFPSSPDFVQPDVNIIASSFSVLSENIETQNWPEYSSEKRDSPDESCDSQTADSEKLREKCASQTFDEVESSYETGSETPCDKVANISSDDGDSGIFGGESQVLESDIETQLSRIEDKYRKLTLGLGSFDYSKFGDENKEPNDIAAVSLPKESFENSKKLRQLQFENEQNSIQNAIRLDPEIQELIDEVNKQYNDYFSKSNQVCGH